MSNLNLTLGRRNERKDCNSVIYIFQPRRTEYEMKIFYGPMGKALTTGINVTRRVVIDALLKEGIDVVFVDC